MTPNQLTQKLLLLAALFFTTTLTAQISQNMTLHDNWDGNNIQRSGVYYNDIWGYIDDANNEYAVIGSPQKIHFIDVSNPNSVSFVQEFTGGSSSIWRDFKDYNRYVYAVADEGSEGLIIFDMTALPSGNIVKVAQLQNHFTRAHNIYIDVPNGRLYVAGSNTRSNGMWVYDIATDPANPILLNPNDNTLAGGYVHDVFVKDNIAYCSHINSGNFVMYDYTDPDNAFYFAFIDTGSANHSSWLLEDGNSVVYAEESSGRPLGLIDITDAAAGNLSIITTFTDPLEGVNGLIHHNPFVRGNHIITSSYLDGVTIYDVTNPSNPNLVAYYDTYPSNNNYNQGTEGAWGVYPFFPSGNIIVSDIKTGLYVVSTSVGLADIDCGNGTQDCFELGVDCDGFCAPCAPPVTCPTDLTINPAPSNIYAVSNTITSDALVTNGSVVEYRAGTCIDLQAPFEVELNADFLAEMNPCTPLQSEDDVSRFASNEGTITAANTPQDFEDVSKSKNDFSMLSRKGSSRVFVVVNLVEAQDVELVFENDKHEFSKTYEMNKGVSRFYVDSKDFPNGTYTVTMSANGENIKRSLVKD